MRKIPKTAEMISWLAIGAVLSGCAGSALNRLPDGSYERGRKSTIEQKAADALRRDGAQQEAREAQKRANDSLEEERKDPAGTFFADLIYSVFGIALQSREAKARANR